MDEQQFFTLLPSNASLDLYKENTLTSYAVHLSEMIKLDDSFEVGLQSVIWPRSFYNIRRDCTNIDFITNTGAIDTVRIRAGFYHTMTELIQAINESLKSRIESNIQLMYDKISEKVYVRLKNGYKLVLEEGLAIILGFGTKQIISESNYSPFVSDLNGGVQCLYIYTDILSYQITGDTKTQLLKVVPVEGKYGETIYRMFDRPNYLPVGVKEFQDIKIDIRDGSGRKIQFEKGRVVINLHFRKRQLSFLT